MTAGTARLAVVQEGETYWFECVAQAASAMAAGFYFPHPLSGRDRGQSRFLRTSPRMPRCRRAGRLFLGATDDPASARFAQWEFVNWTTNAVEKGRLCRPDMPPRQRRKTGGRRHDRGVEAGNGVDGGGRRGGLRFWPEVVERGRWRHTDGGLQPCRRDRRSGAEHHLRQRRSSRGGIAILQGRALAEVSANNTSPRPVPPRSPLGPISGDQELHRRRQVRGQGGDRQSRASFNGVYLQKRVKPVGGAWTGWFTQTTHNPLAGYAVFAESFLLTDRLDDLNSGSLLANSDALNTVWLANGNIQIQSVVVMRIFSSCRPPVWSTQWRRPRTTGGRHCRSGRRLCRTRPRAAGTVRRRRDLVDRIGLAGAPTAARSGADRSSRRAALCLVRICEGTTLKRRGRRHWQCWAPRRKAPARSPSSCIRPVPTGCDDSAARLVAAGHRGEED